MQLRVFQQGCHRGSLRVNESKNAILQQGEHVSHTGSVQCEPVNIDPCMQDGALPPLVHMPPFQPHSFKQNPSRRSQCHNLSSSANQDSGSSREVAAPRQPSPTTVNIASSKLDTETLHLDSRPVPQYSVKKGVVGYTFQHIGDHPRSLRSEDVDDQRTLNLIRQVSNGSAISVEVQDTTLPD